LNAHGAPLLVRAKHAGFPRPRCDFCSSSSSGLGKPSAYDRLVPWFGYARLIDSCKSAEDPDADTHDNAIYFSR